MFGVTSTFCMHGCSLEERFIKGPNAGTFRRYKAKVTMEMSPVISVSLMSHMPCESDVGGTLSSMGKDPFSLFYFHQP